ncbi:MAG: DNA primase [Candidatus Sumerlaeia bacterium]|nr:DNA primase [Candidatus Sumerlaeia bacterium]
MATIREFADEIRASANIVDIIASYIPLKRSGSSYKSICPFHQEKTPSFFVNPARQIFHCFGCGAGGDVLKFLMLFEKVSYREAVEILAKRLGKPLPSFKYASYDDEKEQYRKVLLELHQLAQEFYKAKLNDKRSGASARNYLKHRGVTSEWIEKFGLGYAEGEKQFLEYARSKGFSEKALLDAGLVIHPQEGTGYYDRFRQRLIFPIRDHLGKCIAFGGRGLSEDVSPKYLNSPETQIYQKSSVLYALDLARQEIARLQQAIICEGYFDAIMLHQYGFTNSVATLGTALTDQQAKLLARYCKKVIFLYDGDEAGEKAMLRGAEVLFRNGFQLKVALLPSRHDPDSFLRAEGAEALANIIDKEALDVIEFFLRVAEQRYNLNKADGKANALDMLRPLLREVDNIIIYDQYVRQISEKLSLDEKLIREYVKSSEVQAGRDREIGQIKQVVEEAMQKKKVMVEMDLLALILNKPEDCARLKNEIEICWITNPKIQALVERLFSYDTAEEISVTRLLDECDDDETACIIREAACWMYLAPNYEEQVKSIPKLLRLRYEKVKRRQLIADINKYYELSKEYEGIRPLLKNLHQCSKNICNLMKNK